VTRVEGRVVGLAHHAADAVDRIERLDSQVNAVVVRDFDRARAEARQADVAISRGEFKALTGIPIMAMVREGWLFLVMLLTLLVAMTLFPQIVLWLPTQMGYATG
jgi:hypothetical protein